MLEQTKGKIYIAHDNEKCSREWLRFSSGSRFHTGLATLSLWVPSYSPYLFLLFQTRNHPRWNFNLVIISQMVLTRLRSSLQAQDMYRFRVMLQTTRYCFFQKWIDIIIENCAYTFHWPTQQTLWMSMNQSAEIYTLEHVASMTLHRSLLSNPVHIKQELKFTRMIKA